MKKIILILMMVMGVTLWSCDDGSSTSDELLLAEETNKPLEEVVLKEYDEVLLGKVWKIFDMKLEFLTDGTYIYTAGSEKDSGTWYTEEGVLITTGVVNSGPYNYHTWGNGKYERIHIHIGDKIYEMKVIHKI